MAGKETVRPYFTMSGGSCDVDHGASSAATDLDFGRGHSTMAGEETARPYLTMSDGSCNVDQGASSAAPDLDSGRVPEETREAALQQRENQAASRILQCHVCQFAFTDMDAFKNHAYDHSLGKIHKCSDCGKLFKWYWELARHLRRHGDKSFECGVCGKRFYTKDGHETHMHLFHVGAQD